MITVIHMMADQAIFAKFSAPDPAALQELRRGPCCTTSSVQRTVHVALPLPRHTASAPRKQPFRHCTVSKDLGCIRLLGISFQNQQSQLSTRPGSATGFGQKGWSHKAQGCSRCSQEFQESHHKNDVFLKIQPTFHEFSDQSLSRLESENRKE